MLSEGQRGLGVEGGRPPAKTTINDRVNFLLPHSSLFVLPTPKQQAERKWK